MQHGTSGTAVLGVCVTRSPQRRNSMAVPNVDIAYVDAENGIDGLYYVDALTVRRF